MIVYEKLLNKQKVNLNMSEKKNVEEQQKESNLKFNPIDKDKVAENPHLLPYAHTVGGAVIKPIDKGRVKGLAVAAMYDQTEMQLDQIREQVTLLAAQAESIHKRVEISEKIYLAEMSFKPLISHTYHLYERKNGKDALSMIGPNEWGRSFPFEKHLATVRLLSDHTWEIL